MVDQSKFIPGLELAELFYREVVEPILKAEFPNLAYSAGLLGGGSEVLGYDTPRSMDHDWGPRLLLFLGDSDYETEKSKIIRTLGENLPYEFRGIPTSFRVHEQSGSGVVEATCTRPINHRVEVYSIDTFLRRHLGIGWNAPLRAADWLSFPEQQLLLVSSGKLFVDQIGVRDMIKRFQYFPKEVWLYLLSCEWMKISQEEAFVGRAAEVGDEMGSRLIAAQIVRYLMRLSFLMEKTYAPYIKWFGTAFSGLVIALTLGPVLAEVLDAKDYPTRETALCQAYEIVARKHNSLGITPPLETIPSPFYDRPYRVIHADVFAGEIKKRITDEEVRPIAAGYIGSVDQFVDSTDVLSSPGYFRKLEMLYESFGNPLDE